MREHLRDVRCLYVAWAVLVQGWRSVELQNRSVEYHKIPLVSLFSISRAPRDETIDL